MTELLKKINVRIKRFFGLPIYERPTTERDQERQKAAPEKQKKKLMTNTAPIPNHNMYNKADLARRLKVDRAIISKVMRGRLERPDVLQQIRHLIGLSV